MPPFFTMKTKRGIYLDLRKSTYTFTPIDIPEITFYFSSKFYRNKFANIYNEEVQRFNQALNNVYKNKFNIYGDLLALIRLYCLIEKRGFYLIYKGVEITCVDDLAFVVIPNSTEK